MPEPFAPRHRTRTRRRRRRAWPRVPRGRRNVAAQRSRRLAEFRLQAFRDVRMYECGDVAAELRNLTHQARRDESVLLARRKEDRLDSLREMPIHRRELELVLEVRHGTQTANDRLEPILACEIDRKPRI